MEGNRNGEEVAWSRPTAWVLRGVETDMEWRKGRWVEKIGDDEGIAERLSKVAEVIAERAEVPFEVLEKTSFLDELIDGVGDLQEKVECIGFETELPAGTKPQKEDQNP